MDALKCISVLVPTASRPDYLRNALKSVADQTVVDRILEIIVSENLSDRASEKVCEEFPQLPIKYVFREPSLSPMRHGCELMTGPIRGEFTAILHDDDWWLSDHLAHALSAFASEPDAALYHSGSFLVSGESSRLSCLDNVPFWFGANFPEIKNLWKLSRQEVLVGSMLHTGAYYSSLVAKTCFLQPAAKESYRQENPYDNDRMLTFALTAYGPLLFRPAPTSFYRQHAQQDGKTFAKDERYVAYLAKTTEWLVASSGETWSFLADSLLKRLDQTPENARDCVNQMVQKPWCLPLVFAHLEKDTHPLQMKYEAMRESVQLQPRPVSTPSIFKQILRHPRKFFLAGFGGKP